MSKYDDARLVTFKEEHQPSKASSLKFERGKTYAMHHRVAALVEKKGVKVEIKKLDPKPMEDKLRQNFLKSKAA